MFVLGAVLIGKRSELIKFYELGQGCVMESKLRRQDNGEGRKEGGERDFLR